MTHAVGFVGLGAMGRPMARHLIDKGFEVCGFDPAEAAQQKAMLLGVPEWIDPETGELADDEFVRLEDH